MSDDFLVNVLFAIHLILTTLLPQGTVCVKLTRVNIPQYALHGEQATLQCQYDLQSNRLYAVTWYKDNEEFYRYVPRSTPPQLSYRIDGVKVDHHRSDGQKVALRSVDLRASGVYRCEVSAEGPSFTSVHGEGRMEVVSLPKEDPEITGEERVYQVGDVINLNCTSGQSYPPARLRWYINDLQVGPDYEAVVSEHGLVTSVVGLRLEVMPHHFLAGRMQVRCVATISTGKESVVQHRVSPLIDNREALLLVEGGCPSRQASLAVTFLLAALVIGYST